MQTHIWSIIIALLCLILVKDLPRVSFSLVIVAEDIVLLHSRIEIFSSSLALGDELLV